MFQRRSAVWWLSSSIGLSMGLWTAVSCGGDAPPSATRSANAPTASTSAAAPSASNGSSASKAPVAPAGGSEKARPDGDIDSPDGSDPVAMLEQGSAIYDQYCIACHGADGKGNNGLGGDYRKVLKVRDDQDLIASIKNGKVGAVGSMPPWGAVLDDDQIQAVLHYVKSTFGPQ